MLMDARAVREHAQLCGLVRVHAMVVCTQDALLCLVGGEGRLCAYAWWACVCECTVPVCEVCVHARVCVACH